MTERINRRDFLKRTSAAGIVAGGKKGAPILLLDRRESANHRIAVGFIGVGARATEVMDDMLRTPGFEVVGVCDAYKGRLERAQERTGGRAKVYKDAGELLAAPGVDAVYIGTPDHWHKDHAIAALEAGKDVYIEKPLTYTVAEGLEIIAAVKRTGRILQVGSQSISSPIQIKAREIIQSGKLGQITMIRSTTNRNTAGGAWLYPIPPDANPESVNWELFQGRTTSRPFSLERFFRWRCYQDYSGGIATDLFVHTMTTIHFLMGAPAPECVMAVGDLYRWKEGRDVPDTLNAILQYPEGFTVNLSATFNNQAGGGRSTEILGTEGTLQLDRDLAFVPEYPVEDNGWILDSWPSKLQAAYNKDPKNIAAEQPRKWDPKTQPTEQRWRGVGRNANQLHLESFQRAVRDRQQPVEDAVAGHRAAAVAHMINLSARRKAPVYWDRAKDTIKA